MVMFWMRYTISMAIMDGRKKNKRSENIPYFLARSRVVWDDEKNVLVAIEVVWVKIDGLQKCGV